MEIVQSIILGIIQGLAEFLPISSSGHLILVSNFSNWKDQGLAFDVALHLGTLIAVLIYFRKDWLDIFRNSYLLKSIKYIRWFHSPVKAVEPFVQKIMTEDVSRQNWFINKKELKNDLFLIIMIATIPGVLAGLIF